MSLLAPLARRRTLDTADPFLTSLWCAIPDADLFPPAAGKTPPLLRLVYVSAAAVALASRINEDAKREFGKGFLRDYMPRGPGDATPAHVIEAVSSSRAGDTPVAKWHDFLELMKMVRALVCAPSVQLPPTTQLLT